MQNENRIKYGSWEIDPSANTATRKMPDGNIITISLVPNPNPWALYEGYWQDVSGADQNTVISGVCLWDARWQVEFRPAKTKNAPIVRRSLALPSGRDDIYLRLATAQRITKMFCPLGLGIYHIRLIKWQSEKLRELSCEQILYHVPLDEYHDYIATLESRLGIPIPSAHDQLDKFAQKIHDYIQDQFGPLSRKLEFIRPMRLGAKNPEEAFLFPYSQPEKLFAAPEKVLGVEDLIEIPLSYEAWKNRNQWNAMRTSPIPIIGAIIGIPTPYFNKELQDIEAIELE
ncbi:MAG: hypothetical protein HY454_02520 [Parcubacteria group bacterium]|nr:hypothetical protein [Parcubacteria group bacterium]